MGAGETKEAKSSNVRKGDGRNEEVRMRRETTRVFLQMACRFCLVGLEQMSFVELGLNISVIETSANILLFAF